MCEISGTNYIVSRRMLDHRRMVNGKKFSLPSCSTRPDYPDGGRRYSKSGYRQRTSYFSSDRSALASAVSVSSPVRARKGCSASWAQAAHSTAKNQCYYRGYPPYDATRCDALEHTQYGQGFGRQQSNGMPGYGNSTISSHILSRHSNSVATSSLSGNFKISLGYISIRQTKHWSCVSTKRVRSKLSTERNFYYLYAQAFRRVRHTIIHGTERQLYSLP